MALLALYFNAIIPTEFGVAKPWYFPFTDAKNWWKARKEKKMGISGSEEQLSDQVNVVVTEEVKKLEDMDVAAERERVLSDSYSEDSPLAMKRMRKVYKGRSGLGPKIAVKDVTFAVEEGIVFGLLGALTKSPNSQFLIIVETQGPMAPGKLHSSRSLRDCTPRLAVTPVSPASTSKRTWNKSTRTLEFAHNTIFCGMILLLKSICSSTLV